MNRTLIVVADSRHAHVYGVEPTNAPRAKAKLVERKALVNPDIHTPGKTSTGRPATETNSNRGAGPVHPIGSQRERHHLELDRRFGHEIARATAAVTKEWNEGTVVLVAEPHMLGLLREPLRAALQRHVELKELAKDFAQLGADELLDHLASNHLIPASNRDVDQ